MAGDKKWIFIITLAVAIVSFSMFFVALANGWFGPVITGDGAAEFCERFRPGLVKQPANTWSNLGFITAGLLMAWQLANGQFKSNNSFTNGIFYATCFSCLGVLLGPGSMAMHASGSSSGGFFDMLSMYLVASFIVSYSMQRFFSWQPLGFAISFITGMCICLWANFQTFYLLLGFFGSEMFGIFIAITIVFELLNTYVRKMHHTRAWGFAAMGALFTAFAIWNVTRTNGPFCNPDSLIQGHAIWHLLDALAFYCLFRFYVSEHKEIAS
jgi:hypothetical protein